jgi:hypothetical protein
VQTAGLFIGIESNAYGIFFLKLKSIMKFES